ncbi:MAG TPA: HAD family acid phosphatase [Bacillales bacterium]|nr:HAD family acid phosphatase [Bacillales bacterium]
MKFGFDIDDTLINLREHAFHLYNKKLNKHIELDVFHSLKTLEIHEPFGLTAEEGGKMWNSLLEEIYYTNCPSFPFATEMLHELENNGHEVYYITARTKDNGERTKKWLIENGFPVHDDRFFYGMNDEEKVHIIEELGLDYFFDDKPAVLETLVDKSVRIFAKSNPYNQHLDIPRISDWVELRKIMNEK